eukprot:8547914-Pyramimonas_sp.AAC.1
MSSNYIEAAEDYRCEPCEHRKPLARTRPAALPKKFRFNHEIGIGCLEGGGTPSSRACLTALQHHWRAWA